MKASRSIAAAGLLFAAAWNASDASNAEAAPGGWYRGTVTFKDKRQVPFFVEVPAGGGPGKILNGDEVVPAEIKWKGEKVTIYPQQVYDTKISAKVKPDGSLEGTWNRYSPLWGEIVLPFAATQIPSPDPQLRFPAGKEKGGPKDFSGTYKMKLDRLGEGILRIKQTPDGIATGYLQAKHYGDWQHMAGNVRGGKLYMSSFDGSNVALNFTADLSKDGKKITGKYNVADVWLETFSGARDEAYNLENTLRVKPGTKTIKVPGLDLEKLKGKPVLLFLFATWCPSCNEAQETLKQIHRDLGPKGLQLIAVTYDLEMDQEINKEKAAEFKKLHNLPWEIATTVPGTPETFGQLEPFPNLVGMEALPVTIFLRADGSVAGLHGGFSGPATSPDHEAVRAKFFRLAEEITMKR